MSLLAGYELMDLIDAGILTGAKREYANAASIDVHLGNEVMMEDASHPKPVDLANKELPAMRRFDLTTFPHQRITLYPGQFALAHTLEGFDLPDNISAEFRLRSSVARAGLNHHLASWIDAGFNGSQLTLELFNSLQHHPIYLAAGMRIGQVIFYRHALVPPEQSYRHKGRYNQMRGVGQKTV